MAVIKYQINGKANTKPIKDTEKAAQGMFQKIQSIDNTLKAFVGVKVFSEVGKAVKGALTEYDNFQKSINGESNFSKQFDRIKTAMAGTMGTVRDELASAIGNITGNDGFKKLETAIPKIGATLIGAFKVASAIVVNIRDNFKDLLKPETWNDFFTHAKDLANSFCSLFANLLKDTFSFAINFFKWGFENMNLFNLLWTPARMVFSKVVDFFGWIGDKLNPGARRTLDEGDEEAKKFGIPGGMPRYQTAAETTQALNRFSTEARKTFASLFNTVAGTDVQALYTREYNAALEQLNTTVAAMQEARTGEELAAQLAALIATLKPKATDAVSAAGDKFSNAASYIESILENATAEQAEKVRDKMEGLNKQFNTATERITGLFDELENAKDAKAAENVFKKINDQIIRINGLSESMEKVKEIIEGVEKKFNSLGAKLGAELGEKLGAALGPAGKIAGGVLGNTVDIIGDISTALNALFTSGPVGLIIMLISRLFETFSKISGPFAAFMNIFDVFFDVVEEICAGLEPILSAVVMPI
jgi:phage shock protein A